MLSSKKPSKVISIVAYTNGVARFVTPRDITTQMMKKRETMDISQHIFRDNLTGLNWYSLNSAAMVSLTSCKTFMEYLTSVQNEYKKNT